MQRCASGRIPAAEVASAPSPASPGAIRAEAGDAARCRGGRSGTRTAAAAVPRRALSRNRPERAAPEGARSEAGAERAAVSAAGRANNQRRALTSAAGAAASAPGSLPRGHGAGELAEEGCPPEFPLTFNLGMRCLEMRPALRSAEAVRLLCAEDRQKSPGSSLRHTPPGPAPGCDTPCPRQLHGFPSATTKEVGRREGGRKEQGRRQAGGEGREIRL